MSLPAQASPAVTMQRRGSLVQGVFTAMASPCELLIDTRDEQLARHLTNLAAREAARIEQKFSRYRNDNLIHAINTASGQPVRVDDETSRLLDFANHCYRLSDGLFDVTAGVLRQAWHFDGSQNLPTRTQVKNLLVLVGWEKVRWYAPEISMPAGMEIDLGGIGKEYAVDTSLAIIENETDVPVLVNFGGDLRAARPPSGQPAWRVGVESVRSSSGVASSGVAVTPVAKTIALTRGALTTSGDARKFLHKGGKRYGHVLNPKTGWPVANAPGSVTVQGETCTETGLLATLGLLHGAQAEDFLTAQQVPFWVQR
ncbi:MAG: FAD:protein FMN transferase [Burkholderiaceae bacterium]